MILPFFIGIDVGTQGARTVLVDAGGAVIARREEVFPLSETREEQSPHAWWQACVRSLRSIVEEISPGIPVSEIRAISVTSTSGTVIPLDRQMEPLHPALMYSDKRSEIEGRLCREIALKYHPEGYTGFNASSGLSKMVWFVKNFPEKASDISRWVHAADYITGKLTGKWGVTDYTNALKSGFDVDKGEWPAYLFDHLPLRREWLPSVVFSGTPIGTLDPSLCPQLRLPSTVRVVAGMTDGCASQVSAGAVNLGEWNTTIGTTLVVKGVTRNEIRDPEGRIYSHRHPAGYWMPGGASNTGADWIEKGFRNDLGRLEQEAWQLIPTGSMAYPLGQDGERFPFIAPHARGFEPPALSRTNLFTANLEGVAYLERYAFELIESLSGEKVTTVFSAGGGSKSEVWLKIRSSVLNLPIIRMKEVSGALGAAILAASGTFFPSLSHAAKAMTQFDKRITPDPAMTLAYNEHYQRFLSLLRDKGYITKQKLHA